MGSEFAYEDIASQELEKYNYKYLKDDNINGLDCFIVEFDPVDPKSGYSTQKVWIDKKHFRYQKIEFFDKEILFKSFILKSSFVNKT